MSLPVGINPLFTELYTRLSTKITTDVAASTAAANTRITALEHHNTQGGANGSGFENYLSETLTVESVAGLGFPQGAFEYTSAHTNLAAGWGAYVTLSDDTHGSIEVTSVAANAAGNGLFVRFTPANVALKAQTVTFISPQSIYQYLARVDTVTTISIAGVAATFPMRVGWKFVIANLIGIQKYTISTITETGTGTTADPTRTTFTFAPPLPGPTAIPQLFTFTQT